MTHERFAALARELHGAVGWQSALAREHLVHRSTVLRWATGEIPIPPDVARSVREAAVRKVATVASILAA
jgi:hypothetical protein